MTSPTNNTGQLAEAIEHSRRQLWSTQEEVAESIAWAIHRELKPMASDSERRDLAQAIRLFLL